MSRWKKLNNWGEKVAKMSLKELREELTFWKKHVAELQGPGKKEAIKFLYKVENALRKRLLRN